MSSILAIAAFISALFVFFVYKQNMRGRETANFDFTPRDDLLEYKSFWERIQDDVVNFLRTSHLRRNEDSESESLTSNDQIQDIPVTTSNNELL